MDIKFLYSNCNVDISIWRIVGYVYHTSVFYLIRYWHMGNRRNASATVAMTAVQMAKSICIESKKKNMTSNDIEAPNGRHIACIESNV